MSEFKFTIPETFAIDEAADFREKTNQMVKDGTHHYILDFKKCGFIDSTGLGVLVALYKKCMEQNGSIKLISMNDQVKRVFELTRLESIFNIEK